MVVAAEAVDVPMCQLISRGTTYFRNLDIKCQIHPRQGVIPVQRDMCLGHFRDRDDRRTGVLTGTESIPHLDALRGHFVQRHLHYIARVVFAISVLGLDGHVLLVANLHPAELGFEPGDDLPGLFEKRQRFAVCGGVECLSGLVGQRIVKRNDVLVHAQPFLWSIRAAPYVTARPLSKKKIRR